MLPRLPKLPFKLPTKLPSKLPPSLPRLPDNVKDAVDQARGQATDLFKKAFPPLTDRPAEKPLDEGLRLGHLQDDRLAVDLSPALMRQHLVVFGDNFRAIPFVDDLLDQHVARGGGFLLLDDAQDMARRNSLVQRLRSHERLDDFYILNAESGALTNTWNAVLSGTPEQIATRVMDLLPDASREFDTTRLRQAAQDLDDVRQTLALTVRAHRDTRTAFDLDTLVLCLRKPDWLEKVGQGATASTREELATLFSRYRRRGTNDAQLLDTEKFAAGPGRYAAALTPYTLEGFGAVLCTTEPHLNLVEAVRQNKGIHIALPTMCKDNLSLGLGRLVLWNLRQALEERARLGQEDTEVPFLVIVHSASTYLIPGMTSLLEVAAKANAPFVLVEASHPSEEEAPLEYAQTLMSLGAQVYIRPPARREAQDEARTLGLEASVLKKLPDGRGYLRMSGRTLALSLNQFQHNYDAPQWP